MNHMFDPVIALAMIGGVALPYAVWLSDRVRFPKTLLTILIALPCTLGVITMLPPRIQEDSATSHNDAQLEQEFTSAVDFVKSHPGPALCENLLLCFEAGKPFEFDPYAVDQLVKTGHVPEAAILRQLDEHHFSTISLLATEPIGPAARGRFSQAFMVRLLNRYKPAVQSSSNAIFVPK